MAVKTLPQVVSFPKSACSDDSPVLSYAKFNRKLLEGFSNFLVARGMSPATIRAYEDSARRLVDLLGSKSVVDADRGDIRNMQSRLLSKGVCANSVRLHTAGLRSFFKFVRLSGLTRHDPTLALSQRKCPHRLGRVLTVGEVDSLIAASRTPLETAIIETLYATGVRVAELVQLRLEDIDFGERVARVKNGKGRKDRVVLFGRSAAAAIREYLKASKREKFLFEPPAWQGGLSKTGRRRGYWVCRVQENHVCRPIYLGRVADLSKDEAREKFEQIRAKTRGFRLTSQRPYEARAIGGIVKRVAFRAKLAGVHPHALRRSMATHMLASGADLRSIQELLGHTNLSTTVLYLGLSATNLKEVHEKCHPHAKGGDDAEKE
jgi:site-specific recombinase XerD